MQNIVIVEPYRFVAPMATTVWTWPLRWWVARRMRRTYGIEQIEFRGMEKIRDCLASRQSVLIAANHCRPCDPELVGLLCTRLGSPGFIMASWHLFKQSRLQRILMRAAGVFSVHREGVDREAIRTATALLAEGRRPLVIFPEGLVSRANGRLRNLMEGTAFIARAAAKVRAKESPVGKVVIIPVAVHYYFGGDLRKSLEPVLDEIERRLGGQPQADLPLRERIIKLGEALLNAKEVEYFGQAQPGPIGPRLPKLFERVVDPLERFHRIERPGVDPMERIKTIRTLIVDPWVKGELTREEKDRGRRQLADCYFAQQLACYPVDYLAADPTRERLLETVERFEEDLTDVARIHRPLRAVGQVGDPIEVSAERRRGEEGDVVMNRLETSLRSMLADLESAGTPWSE